MKNVKVDFKDGRESAIYPFSVLFDGMANEPNVERITNVETGEILVSNNYKLFVNDVRVYDYYDFDVIRRKALDAFVNGDSILIIETRKHGTTEKERIIYKSVR